MLVSIVLNQGSGRHGHVTDALNLVIGYTGDPVHERWYLRSYAELCARPIAVQWHSATGVGCSCPWKDVRSGRSLDLAHLLQGLLSTALDHFRLHCDSQWMRLQM